MKICLRTVAFAIAFVPVGSAWAGISIGSGGDFSLGHGALDLAASDLRVDGRFDVADGQLLNAGNILIHGTFEGGTGTVSAHGDWRNNGTFNSGTGSIQLLDDSGSSARITGSSIFHALSMTSSAGGSYVLDSELTQRVTHALTIQGVDGAPVQIRSSASAQVADLWLDPSGNQAIAFVGVSDVHATGQPLAPGQTNQGGSGNDLGWFGRAFAPLAVPTLSVPGLILLSLFIFSMALVRRTEGAEFRKGTTS